MRHNRSIYLATAITLLVIIVVAYFFVSCSKVSIAATGQEVQCEKFSLKVSQDDGARIEELITTLANTSAIGLGMKRRHLVKIGDILDQNVPPLQFLTYIFSRPKLAMDMVRVRKSKMKYGNFVEGLGKNLLKASADPCFQSDVEGFAEFLKVDKKQIQRLMDQGVSMANGNKKSFKPLVNFLIDEKAQ